MPRPHRHRAVSDDLAAGFFGPRGRLLPGVETVELTLDELEAIRLADLEGLYQEAAAERMQISRATFARILAGARRAVADALANRKVLVVGGGAVRLRGREDEEWPCPVHGHRRRRGRGCRCDGQGRGGVRGDATTKES